MSLKYHFQHIKNKTLKNVVFFTFHGTQNETIIFKNQTITIKEQRLHCLFEFNILARHWKVPQNSILVAYRTNHALDSQIAEHLPKYSRTPSTVLSGQNVYV